VLGEFGGLGFPIQGHLWNADGNWGYRTYEDRQRLQAHYESLVLGVQQLRSQGLVAAVYTQTTDVEGEVNGLLTYDRRVLKLDADRVRPLHQALYGPSPRVRTLSPISRDEAQAWRYTETVPGEDWTEPEFDDSAWESGLGVLGSENTPGAVVRTLWTTPDIWARHRFECAALPDGQLLLHIHHDEDAEVYLNGVLVAELPGYTTDYTVVPLPAQAQIVLRRGGNLLAVHCRQTGGGQCIDAGLLVLESE
jgi:hypothetical protein